MRCNIASRRSGSRRRAIIALYTSELLQLHQRPVFDTNTFKPFRAKMKGNARVCNCCAAHKDENCRD